MKVKLSIDSGLSIEISHSNLAMLIGCLPDDLPHAILFSKLCDHPSSEVRGAVASMEFMLSNVLEVLARDSSVEVVRRVANNKRAFKVLKNSLILEMINRDVNIALDIAYTLSWLQAEACTEIVQALLLHNDPQVIEITQDYLEGESQWRRGDNLSTFSFDNSSEEDEWQEQQ